jgi:hypothetical protein
MRFIFNNIVNRPTQSIVYHQYNGTGLALPQAWRCRIDLIRFNYRRAGLETGFGPPISFTTAHDRDQSGFEAVVRPLEAN